MNIKIVNQIYFLLITTKVMSVFIFVNGNDKNVEYVKLGTFYIKFFHRKFKLFFKKRVDLDALKQARIVV